MEKITDSPIKEKIRQQNEKDAKSRENQLRNKWKSRINKAEQADSIVTNIFSYLWFLAGIAGIIYFNSLVKGFFLGLGIWFAIFCLIYCCMVPSIENTKRQMEQEIKNAYEEADRKTFLQIDGYDRDVEQYYRRALQNASGIDPIVKHTVEMFQRMISHADASSNKRFVEADCRYKVEKSMIKYFYTSGYTNIMNHFDFDEQRFRILGSDAECEGLAQALADLTIKEMMNLYPPDSLHITAGHIDAEVTLHFKAANKNFVPAKDIF